MFIVLINDNEGILNELVHVGCDRKNAERHFLSTCDERISNFDEYNHDDIEAVLGNGYEKFGGGVVMLIDTDGCTSDDAIRDELTKQPAVDMTVAEIIQDGEIALTKGMTVDEILEMCCDNLDSACSWEIQGQILFKGSDGKWYTITTESIIAEANPDFVKDVLAENKNA